MTGPALLCAGEAVVDLVPEGDLLRPVPGGAALNTAIAAARLGAPTAFFGALSSDGFGRRLAEAARCAGVDLSLAQRSDAPTPVSIAEPIDGGVRFTIHDAGCAGHAVTTATLPDALPAGLRAVVLGGFSLIAPPAAEAFAALADRLPPGVALYLDLNIRPGLVTDDQAYRARLARLMARADIVKVSDEDLAWLGEDPATLAPAALLLHTKGAAGATARLWRATLSVAAPSVRVVDTVGAGDVFNAAFLAFGLARGQLVPREAETLRAGLDFACRAASLSTTRPGAQGPTEQEMMTCAP